MDSPDVGTDSALSGLPSEVATPTTNSLISAQSLDKWYGGTHALVSVDFEVQGRGEIHGLIGENGSGKSTLLAILSGQARPDSGTLAVSGETLRFSSAKSAVDRGIAMVAQESAVALDLTVTENVLMHRLPRRRGSIVWRAAYERAETVLSDLGVDYDPAAPVRGLRPDQRQMIEIARAVAADAKLVILDEPTSSLTDAQVQGLFETMRRMSRSGVSFILVTHRLPELYEMADRITVLRDGRRVRTEAAATYERTQLVKDMVGDSMASAVVPRSRPSDLAEPPRLALRSLHADPEVQDVTIEVRPGEIVGLAGLAGAGRSEILECAFGTRRHQGTVEVDGNVVAAHTRRLLDAGVTYLPPDRRAQGFVGSMSVGMNLAFTAFRNSGRLSRPDVAAERELAARATTELRLRCESHDVAVSALSGGNQQKVVLGKCLATDPRVLLLDEPTRGVDVGAKGEIHQMLVDAADRGVAILVSSSDTEELLAVCDRIVVINRGRSVSEISAAEANEELIVERTGGYR